MALLNETPAPSQQTHIPDHGVIARVVNARHGVVAAAPGAGGTYTPDAGAGETHVVTLPANGTVTVAAPVSTDGVVQWLSGAELVIALTVPAGSTATVAWDAAYGTPSPPAALPAGTTHVFRFRNVAAQGSGPTWLQSTLAARPLWGLLAAMPPNGAVADGSTYFATDQNGGTPYEMVGGVWTPMAPGVLVPRGKLGGQRNAVALNQSVSTTADVPALTNCQFTYSGRPVSARVVLPWLKDTLLNSALNVFITDVATGKVVYEEPTPTPAAATVFFTARATTDGVQAFADGTALVVGTTYTWKAQFQHAGGAAGTVTSAWAANAAFYGYIEVVEE